MILKAKVAGNLGEVKQIYVWCRPNVKQHKYKKKFAYKNLPLGHYCRNRQQPEGHLLLFSSPQYWLPRTSPCRSTCTSTLRTPSAEGGRQWCPEGASGVPPGQRDTVVAGCAPGQARRRPRRRRRPRSTWSSLNMRPGPSRCRHRLVSSSC